MSLVLSVIFGLGGLLVLSVVAALVAIYVFKINLIERMFGDLDVFWAQRALWGWTPRRRGLPRRSRRGRAPRQTAKEQADAAREAAEKAARWPYE